MFFAVITIIKLDRMGLTKRLVAIFAYAIRLLIVSLQFVNNSVVLGSLVNGVHTRARLNQESLEGCENGETMIFLKTKNSIKSLSRTLFRW